MVHVDCGPTQLLLQELNPTKQGSVPYLLDMAWLPPLGSYWCLLHHKSGNDTSSQPVTAICCTCTPHHSQAMQGGLCHRYTQH
jgi:hypothetical protein